MRRGRRHPRELAAGDTVDFWRVVSLEPPHRLSLLAEMKLPGSAAMGFELQPLDNETTRIVVMATFHPDGVRGLLYWLAFLRGALHAVLFPGLASGIGARAEAAARSAPPAGPTAQPGRVRQARVRE